MSIWLRLDFFYHKRFSRHLIFKRISAVWRYIKLLYKSNMSTAKKLGDTKQLETQVLTKTLLHY